MEDKKITMPAVALRGTHDPSGNGTAFRHQPGKNLIRAIETAMMGNQKVYLVTQRHPEQEVPDGRGSVPDGNDLPDQTARENAGRYHPCDGGRRLERAALLTLFEDGPYLEAEVEEAPMQEEQLYATL